jgi:ammonium transporter, Amt family
VSSSVCSCFAPGIPALLFAIFEAMFALIAPLLMTGAFVGHMRFFYFLVFIALWELLVYYPVAHWVWGGGWLYQMGVHDFAGGIVLHTTAGSSSLALALALGRRVDFAEHKGEVTPHNIPLSNIGAALLWMGWYGFNGGSAFGANSVAVNAVATTTIASCGAALVWLIIAVLRHRSVDSLVLFNGAIAGLAGITPCSGYVSPSWATLIALLLGLASYGSVWLLKEKLKVDDGR